MSNNTIKKLTILNFVIGVVLRVAIIGWMLIVLGVIEIVIRGLFLLANLLFVRNADLSNNSHRNLLFASQLTYLLGSVLAIDFGELGNSYGFLHLWQNPPEEIVYVFVGLFLVNFVISVVMIVKNTKLNRKKRLEKMESRG
ncbi:MAG: hypothetical protein ACJAWV_002281 [Flammeovirgaceae bacterium]|jgi:hypothetical protein